MALKEKRQIGDFQSLKIDRVQVGSQVYLFPFESELGPKAVAVGQNGVHGYTKNRSDFLVTLAAFYQIGDLDFHGTEVNMLI